MNRKKTVIEALLFIVVGTVGMVEALRLNMQPSDLYQMLRPGGYILLLSLTLIMTGVAHFIVNYGKPLGVERVTVSRDEKMRVVSIILLLSANMLLIQLVGYLVASIIFFSLAFRIYGIRFWRINIILSLSLGVGYYIIFVRLFDVIFPHGILFE